MAKYSKDRSTMEAKEDLKTTIVDAPEERFQTEQQINPSDKMGDNKVNAEGFIPKKSKSSGQTLRQEVAAQVIKGKGGSDGSGLSSPVSFGLKEISFSGDTGTMLGAASGTPSMGREFQGKSRVDKRLSDANKDINFNASEQIINEYDNIPPLAASESTVGYNGNPKNTAARSQKKVGLTSAEILYDRSLDFLEKDVAVFVSGQVVQQQGVGYEAYPTTRIDSDPLSDTYGHAGAFSEGKAPVRGNYMPREIKVTFKRDNGVTYVSKFEVTEDDLSCNSESDQVVNSSCTNHKIDMNRAELARQTIDADAGSPTAEHFNPLGRSVTQPTATITYLQDLENATGATVFAAYKFANKARGHYLNRTAKDGQHLEGPAIDALYGHLFSANSQAELEAQLGQMDARAPLFSKNGNIRGSAATLIYAFDSVAKYKTKGDLVNQPRGLKMHIQTADNNMDPFRCKSEFIAALNSIDAYSTIDHEYDPMAPVCITDNVRLIYPYSWRTALEYSRTGPYAEKKYQSEVPAYIYSAGSGLNTYMVLMADPVLNGVAYFLEQHANAILDSISSGDMGTLTIPVVHSTTHFSLWDLLVCASTPYIIYERTNTMKDILDYEMFYKYPLQGNVRIQEAQPTLAVNYSNPSTTAPLQVKQMLPSSALRWKFPEMMSRTTAGLLMPFYFNERSYDFLSSGKNSTLKWNGDANFTTPVVRSGVKLGGLDDFFGVEVKDNLLLHDCMVRIPGLDARSAFSGCIYKYSADADGQIVVREAAFEGKTAADYLATPRLLGWFMDLPYRMGCVSGEDVVISAAANIPLAQVASSFRAVSYKGIGSTQDQASTILAPGSVNVGRAQAFRQNWYMARAGAAADRALNFDLILSLCEGFKSVVEGGVRGFTSTDNVSQFMPFMYGDYSVVDGLNENAADNVYSAGDNDKPAMFSIHRIMWTIMQKMPFIINPFDNAVGSGAYVDPYSIAYVFGLAGFMAANYDEELYNRINEVLHQGYGYTSDPMVSASIVFKDAYKHTQIG